MKISKQQPGENARMYAYRVILDNILHLELQPGSAVSENELSQILNVSRTPVREALIEMNRLGLVEILPQRGSFVTKIDYDLIEESKFLRLSLENSVVRLICSEGLSPHYLHLLKENMRLQKQYEQSDDSDNSLMELDNDFHRLLFESIGKLRTYHVRPSAQSGLPDPKGSKEAPDHQRSRKHPLRAGKTRRGAGRDGDDPPSDPPSVRARGALRLSPGLFCISRYLPDVF